MNVFAPATMHPTTGALTLPPPPPLSCVTDTVALAATATATATAAPQAGAPCTDRASLYALYAEFLRSVYATAHAYATHAGDDDVECYDVVRAMRRELIDPQNGTLAALKPLFQVPSSATPQQVARLNEHVEGAVVMLENQCDDGVIEEAMFACLTSGASLSEAVRELQQEYVEREREKQERYNLIASDPTAKAIWESAMHHIGQGRGAQVFGVPSGGNGHGSGSGSGSGSEDEAEDEEAGGEDDDDICRDGEGDEEYAVRRTGRCVCAVCSAVAHTHLVWAQWAPSDAIEQHVCELASRLSEKMFEGALDVLEEDESESEYESYDYEYEEDGDGDDDVDGNES